MRPAARLSVVIPTLNEAQVLPALLADLARQTCAHEVIVADGGSSDPTCEQAEEQGARALAAERGRGRQMNAGARAALAPALLFLHADTRLPSIHLLSEALAALESGIACGDDARVAGHFGLRFLRQQPGHETFYRFLEGKTRLNRPYTINGDQGLLIPRRYFETLGGFDERLPFLEDQRLATRIFASGRWILLPGHLETSARRFEVEGHAPRYALMGLMTVMDLAEADDFFACADALYREHAQAGRLDTLPLLRLALSVLRRRPLAAQLQAVRSLGRLASHNAWQLPYLLDTLRADPSLTWLGTYDRYLSGRRKKSAGP